MLKPQPQHNPNTTSTQLIKPILVPVVKNDISYFKVSKFHSPRASFTSFLYTILGVLEDILPINKNEIEESLKFLARIREAAPYTKEGGRSGWSDITATVCAK